MHLTEASKPVVKHLLSLKFPEGTYIDVKAKGELQFQSLTQESVRQIRQQFPGTIWKKSYRADCGWWAYDGDVIVRRWIGSTLKFHVHIYAVKEAPATCKAIVETYEVEEQVPVQFETRTVVKERVKWDCGNGDEA